ncbi:hypothetical protein ISR92_03130 [Patescibacteria group bacterium]|nr:hypothetical protein [Patescibacteria group bacterium]
MDKLKKLLQKVSLKDRKKLLAIVEKLLQGEENNFNIIKIKNTDFWRLKTGRFRIIFHKENRQIIIDSIRLRNDNTYKDL